MLGQKAAEAMQRILARDVERFTQTVTLLRLVEDGIGTKRGKSVYFSAKDRDEMRKWLVAKGYATTKADLTGLTRSERLAHTPNEKAGGAAIKVNRVSIKALSGEVLMVGDKPLFLPAKTHLDANWEAIASRVGHRSIMVIENYENFDRLHETAFDLPAEFGSPLAIYRGDPQESRADRKSTRLNSSHH